MTTESQIPLLILIILLSAFFSGVEIAFVTSNKFKLELDKTRSTFSGNLLRILTKSPSRLLGTLLIGNNICLVVFGIIMEQLLSPPIREIYFPYFGTGAAFLVLITQTIISTILILTFGEFFPKALFRINPNNSLKYFAPLVLFFHYLLALPVKFTIWVSKIFLRYVFRAQMAEEQVSFERTDLDYYLRQLSDEETGSTDDIENEVKILQNALEFPTVKAKECLIPRTEIIGVEVKEPIETLKEKLMDTGLSKIMVYRDTIDDIIGYVHSFALFKKPETIAEVLLPVMIVPETMLAKDILTQFIQQHSSVAVVVDEYGGTAGILTMEDIIEEIIGEIEDEHDVEELVEKQLGHNTYLLSARLEIDYLNETYALDIPVSDEYETLAGFILHHTEHIPQRDEFVTIDPYEITIKKVSDHRIDEVLLKTGPEEEKE